MNGTPAIDTIDSAVKPIFERGDARIAVTTPLGLGMPNHLLNALYRRVKANPSRHLTLYTALSLDLPEAGRTAGRCPAPGSRHDVPGHVDARTEHLVHLDAGPRDEGARIVVHTD